MPLGGDALADTHSTASHGPEPGLERLIFFSDAVFAIAITLLVIDIHVPHIRFGSPDTAYWQALLDLIPAFVGFFISFFVIGSFWAGHHRLMLLASHYAPGISMPNLVFLSSIAAMPFFTAFSSANPMSRVPAFCYCLWMLWTALLNRHLQKIVTRPPVLDESVSRDRVDQTRQRGRAVVMGAASAAAVSLFVPVLGQPMLATIPLWRLAIRKWEARRG